MERFNFQKMDDFDVREWYVVKMSNRFAGLENMYAAAAAAAADDDNDDDVDISRNWEA
jgi:hypothetical protein